MKLDIELIEKVSKLSNLNLTDDEKAKYLEYFKAILDAFSVIDKFDVKDVKCSFRPIEEGNVLREDVVKESIGSEEALKFTKNKEDGFFIGPKTVE